MLGPAINKIIAKENLSYGETRELFKLIIENKDTGMNQGAFLAALTTKGATPEEISAIRDIIYEYDTERVEVHTDKPLVENSGTGMDTFKTFNVSTGASVVAASCGVAIARHCSRAVTSKCGAVDVCEALGVEVEADSDFIAESIESCGIGIFNGMSSKIHPVGLSRILSNIGFGTVLNTAASLANPACPLYGVRGVNDPEMMASTVELMKRIGYRRCMVMHGFIGENTPAMDEASTLGKTAYMFMDEEGEIKKGCFYPEEVGLTVSNPDNIRSLGNAQDEAKRLIRILSGVQKDCACDIVLLNAALILLVCGKADSVKEGILQCRNAVKKGCAAAKLKEWISTQSFLPEKEALAKFKVLENEAFKDVLL